MILTPDQIASYAAAAGFQGDDLVTAVAIALAESGGNPAIPGDQTLAPTRGPSIGLWQINIGSKAHPNMASLPLTDPQTNANAAFAIYSGRGQRFVDWTTYTDGDFQKYLGAAQAGVIADASSNGPVIQPDGMPAGNLTPANDTPGWVWIAAAVLGVLFLSDLVD